MTDGVETSGERSVEIAVRIDDETLSGPVVDLRETAAAATADAVAAAARGEGDGACRIEIDCPDPGPAHAHVGAVHPDCSLRRRTALAAAARSRGLAAPQDDALASVREQLDEFDPPAVDLADARRRVADASDAEDAIRERVATLQGEVRALRESASDAERGEGALREAEADLEDATARLAEIETERIAAEQALSRARDRARESRATRRERLRLEDRAANLRRAAREYLASEVDAEFVEALDALPDRGSGVPEPDGSGTPDPMAATLAVARVAALDAPVALDARIDVFDGPTAASRWLDAPLIVVGQC